MIDKESGDIDIDFADRNTALSYLQHIPASMIKKDSIEKHNTGVYFHSVPIDPITNQCSVDYNRAHDLGLYKIDLLNVWVYEQIKNEEHLLKLIDSDIDWKLFEYIEFVEKLIHLGNHAQLTVDLKPTSINDLAIILALIRPGKKHLVSKCKKFGFSSIEDEIWKKTDSFSFKKSHSLGYAMLVKVHASLILDSLSE